MQDLKDIEIKHLQQQLQLLKRQKEALLREAHENLANNQQGLDRLGRRVYNLRRAKSLLIERLESKTQLNFEALEAEKKRSSEALEDEKKRSSEALKAALEAKKSKATKPPQLP